MNTANDNDKHGRSTAVRGVVTFVACAVVYYLVLEVFLGIPICNTDTQIRPASAVGPVLGLFFGWPGSLGCAFGNLVSDMASEGDAGMLALYTGIQVIYNAFPYFVWYIVLHKRDDLFPSLASVHKVVLYLIAMIADAALVTLLLMPFEPDSMQHLNIHIVRMLNNAVFLVYVGVPLLIGLELSPLEPHAPAFVDTPYRRPAHANLTQRFLTMILACAGIVIACILVWNHYAEVMSPNPDYAGIIDRCYIDIAACTTVVLLPALMLMRYMETRFTHPIERLTQASSAFAAEAFLAADGAADAPVSVKIDETGIKPRYEMRELFDATDRMRADLVDYVGRFEKITAEREREAAELDIARRIQLASVPHDFKELCRRYGVDIAGYMRPARMVGGDFYDVFETGDGRIAFVIGDVSGKGVPASLFMMRAQSLLREHILSEADMGAAFASVNDRLCDRNDETLFVTAFACILDPATGEVLFANAGHNPPVVAHADGSVELLSMKPGLVLGAMEGMPYRQGRIELAPSERLLLYTDGVTEAMNTADELYREGRLIARAEELLQFPGISMDGVVYGIVDNVDAFAGEAPQADDITLLGFARQAPAYRIELVPTDDQLDKLFAWLDPVCSREGMTPHMKKTMMLVLEEIFINTCHYGYPEDMEPRPVVIEASADDARYELSVVYTDEGVPYNPLTFEAQKAENADDARVGGLGILLVKKNLDDITYERAGERNILRMRKAYV